MAYRFGSWPFIAFDLGLFGSSKTLLVRSTGGHSLWRVLIWSIVLLAHTTFGIGLVWSIQWIELVVSEVD